MTTAVTMRQQTGQLDRRLRLRVYRDGRIVAHIDVPYMNRTISYVTLYSWASAFALCDRLAVSWKGLDWNVVVKHQGINPVEVC